MDDFCADFFRFGGKQSRRCGVDLHRVDTVLLGHIHGDVCNLIDDQIGLDARDDLAYLLGQAQTHLSAVYGRDLNDALQWALQTVADLAALPGE